MIEFIKDNILYILAIVIFIFLSLVLFSIFNIKVIDNNINKNSNSKVVTIESFDDTDTTDNTDKTDKTDNTDNTDKTNKSDKSDNSNDKKVKTDIKSSNTKPLKDSGTKTTDSSENTDSKNLEFHNAFCKIHEIDHERLEEKCNNLDDNSCKMTRCCVLVNEISGNICSAGDKFGPIYLGTEDNPKKINYYYYKNTCHPKEGKCPIPK